MERLEIVILDPQEHRNKRASPLEVSPLTCWESRVSAREEGASRGWVKSTARHAHHHAHGETHAHALARRESFRALVSAHPADHGRAHIAL